MALPTTPAVSFFTTTAASCTALPPGSTTVPWTFVTLFCIGCATNMDAQSRTKHIARRIILRFKEIMEMFKGTLQGTCIQDFGLRGYCSCAEMRRILQMQQLFFSLLWRAS